MNAVQQLKKQFTKNIDNSLIVSLVIVIYRLLFVELVNISAFGWNIN